jgi:hypothetical protein
LRSAWELLAVPDSLRGAAPSEDAVLVPREISAARLAVRKAAFAERPVTELAQAWAAEELKIVEAAETVKAWADAQALAALRRLHEAVGLVVEENADNISYYTGGEVSYQAVLEEAMTATVDEVVLATGLPQGQVFSRVTLALDEQQRCAPVLAASPKDACAWTARNAYTPPSKPWTQRWPGPFASGCWLPTRMGRSAPSGPSPASCVGRFRCIPQTRRRPGPMPLRSGARSDG